MADAWASPFERPDAGFNTLNGWTWIGTYGGHYLQADLLADFAHGFFTRRWQGRDPEVLAGFLSAGVSVHRPKQIHSSRVLPASAAAQHPWPEADGLWSNAGGQSLWVCGADCTPVLIADPDSGRVAACHAGWRGVAGRILPVAIAALEAAGSRRERLQVALGPAVNGDRYQVERAVSLQLAAALRPDGREDAEALAELIACGALRPDPDPSRDRLDIRLAALRQLEHEGIPGDHVALCPLCTVAEPALFHSWRRDQVKAVQWSGIVDQS
jgi:YfiH family protein